MTKICPDFHIIGNWKSNSSGNLSLIKECTKLFKDSSFINACENMYVAIAPQSIYIYPLISELGKISKHIHVCCQNISDASEKEVCTGEINTTNLKELNVKYSIIGHSERRSKFSERNEQLLEKCKKSFEQGIIPILCIGESKEDRHFGKAKQVCQEQLKCVFEKLKDDDKERMIIAYEPVWAIGSGKAANTEQIEEACKWIREISPNNIILYGGSVDSKNSRCFLSISDVNGLLIGKSSLDPNEFKQIVLNSYETYKEKYNKST